MELIVNDYTQNYTSYKQELDTELNKAADGFVKIGYLLKVARDTNVLAESGYKNVSEFAKAEYGLSKDVVSRYIAINDRYSEEGNSPYLAARFCGFGLAKLAEMLTLPDAIVDEISSDTTKDEIRLIKKEYAEEQVISDIELEIEKAEHAANEAETEAEAESHSRTDLYQPRNNMQQLIYDFLHNEPGEYLKLSLSPGEYSPARLADILSPSGNRTIIGRIPGTGKLMLSLRTADTDIIITNMRTSEKEIYTWAELQEYIYLMCYQIEDEDTKERWENIYNDKWTYESPAEKKSAVADAAKKETVTKSADKPKKRKESKVTVIKKDKKAQNVPEESENVPESVTVEVVPGVEVEVTDISKATEAAMSEELKATIEAVPSHVAEESEDVNTIQTQNNIIETTDKSEKSKIAPAQPEEQNSAPLKMPKEMWDEAFAAYYNAMDSSYQAMKKALREKRWADAIVLEQKTWEDFGKIIEISDQLEEEE